MYSIHNRDVTLLLLYAATRYAERSVTAPVSTDAPRGRNATRRMKVRNLSPF